MQAEINASTPSRLNRSATVRSKAIDIESARRLMGPNFFGVRELNRFYPSIQFSEKEFEESSMFPWSQQFLQSTSPFDRRKKILQTHFAFFSPAHFGKDRGPTLDNFNDLQSEALVRNQTVSHQMHEETVGAIREHFRQERLIHASRVKVFAQPSTIMESECRPGWHLVPIPTPAYPLPNNLFQKPQLRRLMEHLPLGYTLANNAEMVIALHLFMNLVWENTEWSLKCLTLDDQKGSPCFVNAQIDVRSIKIEEWNERIEERENVLKDQTLINLALSVNPILQKL